MNEKTVEELEQIVADIFYSYPSDDTEQESIDKGVKKINDWLAAQQSGDAIEFVKWLGENYDFNHFEKKWGFWEIDEGINNGFDETSIADLYNIFKSQPPSNP